MIANTAFLAALTTFLIVGLACRRAELPGAYKTGAVPRCTACVLAVVTVLVFLNLCGVYYWVARWLFLRDTGRKLTHVDRQLGAADGVLDELRHKLSGRSWRHVARSRSTVARHGPLARRRVERPI